MAMRKLAAALCLVAFAAMMPAAQAVETPDLDGVWEGTLHFRASSFAFDEIPDAKLPQDARLRIEIHGPVVNVILGDGDKSGDGSPGFFHIEQVKTNAIIFGTDYRQGDGPGWTESFAIIVTPKDDKTLLVSYSRLVNNSGFSGDEPNLKFATHVDGELTRVRP
jgi:hypothetical protein